MATGLKKSLGLFSLTCYAVGMIIGAGIYSVIGAAAELSGPALWLSFVVAALVALLTALSYCELATSMPQAGAEYVYASEAFPKRRWPAFILGFILLVAAAGTACTVALAFGGYLSQFIGVAPWIGAAAVLALASIVNLVGMRESSGVNIAFTLIEVLGLGLIIWLGAGADGYLEPVRNPDFSTSVVGGAALIFFVFLGFEDIANITEEAKDPGRTFPRAILASLALTTTLYVLVSLAVVALIDPAELARSESPLVDAARSSSPAIAKALGGIALFSTANTVLIALLSGSRRLFAMARGGDMPRLFSKLSGKQDVPRPAIVAVTLAAAAFLPLGRVAIVASFASAASLVAFAAVSLSLIVLRYRKPDLKRPFRVPGSIGKFPVLPAIGVALTLGLGAFFETQIYVAGAVTLAIGAAAYAVSRAMSKSKPRLKLGK